MFGKSPFLDECVQAEPTSAVQPANQDTPDVHVENEHENYGENGRTSEFPAGKDFTQFSQ